MRKKLSSFFLLFLLCLCANAQNLNFGVQSDGSFKTPDGKSYIIIDCPGYTQEQLFYSFLVTIQHKCVTSELQFSTVDNKCINVYSYESYFENYGTWTGGFTGYLYYKFMFQFKDGKVRIEDPIVDHLGNGAKNTIYLKFVEMLHQVNRPLFNPDGTVVAKRVDTISSLNNDLNKVLNDIIDSALSVAKWE